MISRCVCFVIDCYCLRIALLLFDNYVTCYYALHMYYT